MYTLLPYGSCLQMVTNLRDVKSSALHNKNTKTPDGVFIANTQVFALRYRVWSK